jgi:hypothetical protein
MLHPASMELLSGVYPQQYSGLSFKHVANVQLTPKLRISGMLRFPCRDVVLYICICTESLRQFFVLNSNGVISSSDGGTTAFFY